MKVSIGKARNYLGDNLYRIEIESNKSFITGEYQKLKDAVQSIVDVMNPKIARELRRKKAIGVFSNQRKERKPLQK